MHKFSFFARSSMRPSRTNATRSWNSSEVKWIGFARIGSTLARTGSIGPRCRVRSESNPAAFVERVLDIPDNRSHSKLEGVFLLTERLTLERRLTWQHTHGGLRAGSPTSATFALPGDFTTQETVDQLDRLLRDNYLRTGIGVTYSLQRMSIFADFSGFIAGSDTHRIRALALGVNFPFQLRRFSE